MSKRFEPLTLRCLSVFCDVSAEGRGASEAPPPSMFGKCRNLSMRFSLNGRASKLDFDDVQLMTVFEPEIKMAVLNQKKI